MPDVGDETDPRARGSARGQAGAAAAQPTEAALDRSLLVAPLEECPICLNGFERPSITPCSHWFCRWASPQPRL